MPYTECQDLPMFLGKTAAVRRWSKLLQAGKKRHLRIAILSDSWGYSHAGKWLSQIQATLPGVLYDTHLREIVYSPEDVTWSLDVDRVHSSNGKYESGSTNAASSIATTAQWQALTARKPAAPSINTSGQWLRLHRRGLGGTMEFGGGSYEAIWPTGLTTIPMRMEFGVKPYASMGGVDVYWRRSTSSSPEADYQAPYSGHAAISNETVACSSAAGPIEVVSSGEHSPDWSAGQPIVLIGSADNTNKADVAWCRLIYGDPDDHYGISLENWAISGSRLIGSGANSWQVAAPDIGEIFALQGYDGVICNLGFNDFLNSATAANMADYATDFLTYIRAAAANDGIPVMFTGGNPCASTDSVSSAQFGVHRTYGDAIREACEADGGPCMVFNLHGLLSRFGWNERSQRHARQWPITSPWTSGAAATAGTIYYCSPAFGTNNADNMQQAFMCMTNHTMGASNYPSKASGALQLWRPVRGGCNNETDGIHPTERGGMQLARAFTQGLARLKGEFGGGGFPLGA